MSDAEATGEPIPLDELARAVLELSRAQDASGAAAGLLELVQRWASPSAVLGAVRDAGAPSGWRLLPLLCSGSLTLGIEKTLARLAEDNKESLERPTLLRGEEVPGVRVRDNVVVPWWCEGDSGLLVLRGVPRPSRAGLGEALALAGAAVWPRLLGSPAARVEQLLGELRKAAARVEAEAGRAVERLHAATPSPPAASETEIEALARELESARARLEAGHKEHEAARHKLETAGLDLAAARQQADNARRELEAAREERRSAERELEAARRELASLKRGDAALSAPAPESTGDSAFGSSAAAVPESAQKALRAAVAAVRRAAFVPPLLRVTIEDVAALASAGPRAARRLGIVLLDRDVVTLEPVAEELEAGGIEVRLATQAEELALLLRTPDAAQVDAIVCDVMSFRPDQNVAGLLRGWDKDRPGLACYLSYEPQSPVELERARRTPMSLTAGHIQRPLTAARLAETLDNLAKRLGRAVS